jgi:hypothetical protein
MREPKYSDFTLNFDAAQQTTKLLVRPVAPRSKHHRRSPTRRSRRDDAPIRIRNGLPETIPILAAEPEVIENHIGAEIERLLSSEVER